MDSVLPNRSGGLTQPSDAGDDEVQFLLASMGFGFRMHEHLDPKKVGYIAVNDAAALTGCDRFTIVVVSGRQMRVMCMTGQESVSRRSETIRRLEKLSKLAIAMDRALVYSGEMKAVDPLVVPSLSDYVESSRVRMIAMLPLRKSSSSGHRKQSRDRIESQPATNGDREPFGLLIAESFGNSIPNPRLPRRCRLIADHVESAMAAAKQHHKIPFRRTITLIADLFAAARGRRLLAVAALSSLFVATAFTLTFVPATFRVPCKGILMPVSQQRYFAPMDAKVTRVLVEDGQHVRVGDVLLQLASEVLEADIVAAEVSVSENRKLVEALSARMSTLQSSGSDKNSIELQAEMAKAEVGLAGAIETLRVMSTRREELTVRAIAPGVVNGFRLRETMLRRPVDRGDKLLEIVEPGGEWRLELEVDEYRAGPIVEALATSSEPPAVKYVLATKVNEPRWAQLKSVAAQIELSNDGQSYVLHALASTSLNDAQPTYIGAEVFAKVHAGERPLGYVLFGDVLDFIRRTVWF